MKTAPSLHILPLVALGLGSFTGSATAEDSEDEKKKTIEVAAVDPEFLQSPSARAGALVLRNDDGREMEARLLSAHGETIRIQRADDAKEFEVPISVFDDFTEQRIRSWIEEDPEAVEFSLSIEAQRNLVDSNTFEVSGRSFKSTQWAYRVSLTNQTRNALNGAEVEYRIIYDDNVEFSRTSAMPGEGARQQEGQKVALPEVAFNDQVEFTTPAVETQTYEYVPTRGDREYSKDEIKGIWIRVSRHGELIGEYKSNEAGMASLSWDNEDEVEITVTNKFRDSFTD